MIPYRSIHTYDPYCRLPIAGSQRFKGTKAESGPLPLAIYIQFFNAGPDSDEEFHLNGMFNDMWAASRR